MSEQSRELWNAAVAAGEQGDTARAETLFRRLLEEHPDSFEAIDAVFVLAARPARRADPLRVLSSFVRSSHTGYG
jgi:hypothetical protein